MANILLVSLSKITKEISETKTYISDQGTISGRYTPDAPVKYIFQLLHSEGKTLDKILCIATKETLIPMEQASRSAYDLFCDMVSAHCSSQGRPLPEIITIPNAFSSFQIAQPIREILSHIHANDSIFLDTTGGARNTSYLLMFLVRFLEYDNVRLEKAVYSSLGSTNAIVDVTSLYQMFHLINAANTFAVFGNVNELDSIFRSHKNPVIHRTINAMHQFSDAIQLCRTNLDDTLNELNESLCALSGETLTDENEMLFQRIIGMIRKKFFLTDGKTRIDYLDIIRWCLDNNLLQQAITVYVEKLPDYLCQHSFLTVSPQKAKEIKERKSVYPFGYELFYVFFLSLYDNVTPPNALAGFLIPYKENDNILDAICNADNVEQLRKKTALPSAKSAPDLIHGLNRFYTLKNILFDRYGKQKHPKNLKQFPEYQKYADRLLRYKTPLALLKAAVNEPKQLLSAIQGSVLPQGKYQNGKLNTIDQLERLLKETNDFQLAKFLSIAEMQQIAKDYLYIKVFVRNVVNHASSDTENLEEYAAYFQAAGYNTDDVLQTDNVKSVILRSINQIQTIQNAREDKFSIERN
ncbi:TM1812 family CRISPR-associated protein [Ruminococcus sp.]|uniref:TM1812 family CRISPR-associated protein n=1 Tax=Ruminococcus sp. TaxID=41978 RepID=UPI0025F4B34F|nr:TM1812 family CRISPR-associated protein [Ruminococcus sp.]